MRSLDIVDPVFGVIVFIAVLTAEDIVEIADFTADPGYWELVNGDPDD